MAKSLRSRLLLALVLIGTVFMEMCVAPCYVDLAIRFSEYGGEYVYLQACYADCCVRIPIQYMASG
jgi:amino acid transporter